MTDAKKMIDEIISSLSDRENAPAFAQSEKIYRDEPIITTAAKAAEVLPEKYRDMKRLASDPDAALLPESARFYRQGKFMEDFEDDYEHEAYFMKYFPTYRQMSDRQLRTYFTWRAGVRRGEISETSLSYVYVYIYELLNLIGVDSPVDAFRKLRSFAAEYAKIDPSVRYFAGRWASDMKIYYGIEEKGNVSLPDAAGILSDPSEHTDGEVFGALCAVSSFDPQKSKLYRLHPEETEVLMSRVFSAFSGFCEKARKQTLADRLFGKVADGAYIMFPSAVFYDRDKSDREYCDGSRKFSCKNGRWTVTGRPETKKKNTALGSLLKTVDSLLRPYFGMEQTKPGRAAATLGQIVEKQAALYFEEKKREEAKKIEFDFSKLDSIRLSADAVRDSLVIEDDAAEEEPDEIFREEDDPAPSAVLSETEREILRLILCDKDAAGFAKAHGTMLTVAVDAINEKLFDEFYDNAIEFDGDTPKPVVDYADGLKGYI